MKKLIIIFLTFSTACHQQTKDINQIIVVPNIDNNTTNTPPPSNNIYLPFNFIVDSIGEIFYYQQNIMIGMYDVNEDTPRFINLQPKDIIHIPGGNIEEFLRLNILTIPSDKRMVSIALICDSIKSVGVSKIINKLNDSSNITRWLLRHATEEESIVLDYKQRQKRYFVQDIKWDSSRIRFPPENSGR